MKDPGKRQQKAIVTVLVIAALLMAAFLFGRLGGAPDDPMEKRGAKPSEMYLVTSRLYADSGILENMPNASVTAKEANEAEITDEEIQQEEEESTDSEEPPEYDESIFEETSKETSSSYGSLTSLIQKNENAKRPVAEPIEDPGGHTGYEGGDPNPASKGTGTALSDGESEALFTTSIINGDEVTEPSYPFRITLTEKGKALTLVSRTLTVNGNSRNCGMSDSAVLSEGKNSVTVSIRFRDANYNQVDASHTYTLYYFRENSYYLFVSDAKRNQEIPNGSLYRVVDPELKLSCTANKGNDPVNVRVRVNAQTINCGDDGLYTAMLKLGDNELKVLVGTGVNQFTYSAVVHYQTDNFSLEFESYGADERGNSIRDVITAERFGQKHRFSWANSDQSFAFRVSCSQVTGLERITYVGVTSAGVETDMTYRAAASGYVSMTLGAYDQDAGLNRGNSVYVEFIDSNGELQNYTWLITYERTFTPEDRKPVVRASISDGQSTNENPYHMTVNAWDYLGNELDMYDFNIRLNGQEQMCMEILNGYIYYLDLYEGPNIVEVTVTDHEQYKTTRTYTINYTGAVEQYYISLTVDASVLGFEPWISETIPVDSGQTVAQVVTDRLQAYGFDVVAAGTVRDGEYYLSRIVREGILAGWEIPESQRLHYADEGYEVEEPADMNSLGEKDFTLGSGWMVSFNDEFIGSSMGSTYVRNGSRIRVAFTCDIGRDVGSVY